MARSWDARVRGASQKVTVGEHVAAADAGVLDTPAMSESPTTHDHVVDPGVEEVVPTPPHPEEAAGAAVEEVVDDGSDETAAAIARENDQAELLRIGLTLAVEAVRLPVVLAERSTGLIRWASSEWLERFGEKDLIARHMPNATEFGESPLPSPGESWQRTRALLYADGGEELVDLVLTGTSIGDVDYVSVVAKDKVDSAAVLSDRQQVIAIIDGAMKEMAEGSVAVLYVDLDRFKVVHDLVGNAEALRLLDLVNHRIASTVRASDLLFRLPSDEFVVVASELEHPGAAEELAERIRQAVATLADVGHDMALTASVGVALADGEETGDTLLSASETAVYVAKGRGRNRIAVHDEELRNRTQRLMVVERQLRRAIDRRDVRFAYQPVIEIASGEVCGAEALLRLGGEVGLSAVEVVAAAEHSGLMGALGALVFEGVGEQLEDLLRAKDDPRVVMVNLSLNQMADEELLDTMAKLAADDSIEPGRLAVEIPELVVRDHRLEVDQLAGRIRPDFLLGVDGFGSGMLQMEEFDGVPLDYVKLHRSITTSLVGSSEADVERIRRMIQSARDAGIDVIALGVETPEQAEALLDLGCTRAQGFLYAGAVTADNLRQLIETGVEVDVAEPESVVAEL